jgi:hypothetical protein
VVIYRNTLNQRQYVLFYTECPSEGGIADVVYPCNTTLCFGGRDYEKLEKNTISTFTNEIAE